MSLKKTYLKSKPVCKVTFKITRKEAGNADKVHLVGDFNDWDTNSVPMKRLKNGNFTATLELAPESEYQFRYLLDNNKWENDWAADTYVPSAISYDENSVVAV